MTAPLVLEILAFSSCDRSEGNPGKVGPIRFRVHDRDDHPLYVQTDAHDLPGALRSLADMLEHRDRPLEVVAPRIIASGTGEAGFAISSTDPVNSEE